MSLLRLTRLLRLRGVVLLAVILGQLAALGSPLARAHTPAGAVEICGASGLRRLPAEPGQSVVHGTDHCPLCRVAQPLAGPPAVLDAASLALPAVHAQPAAPASQPRPAPIRHAAPRGPPR